MIIATAGHVDHGKTALIRQLTGVDTDRLEEEKRRGLSINLGFAYLPCERGTPVGFIDVPGHRRFINTMIAGIGAIDMALLVIAADDGPMPQTLEHLDILQLLGVQQLAVVITKVDRVEAGRLRELQGQITELLAPRTWENWSLYTVANPSGEGVEELRRKLLNCRPLQRPAPQQSNFHLSVDRAFSLKGAGLVVTGTVAAGEVRVGDTLQLLPADIGLRLRGLRVHDQEADTARLGQRCALNVSGDIDAASLQRGHWLVSPGTGAVSERLDALVTLLANAPFPLKPRAPVKLYIGAKRVAARLHVLDTESGNRAMQPGDEKIVRLQLDEAVCSFRGQRFVLRDHAQDHLLGGGVILDPDGPVRGKSSARRIGILQALQGQQHEPVLQNLLHLGEVVDVADFCRSSNLKPGVLLSSASLPASSQFEWQRRQFLVSTVQWEAVDSALMHQLNEWHRNHPEAPGIAAAQLALQLGQDTDSNLINALLADNLRRNTLTLSNGMVSVAGFQIHTSGEEQRNWQDTRSYLASRGMQIPLLSEVAQATGLSLAELDSLVRARCRAGELHRLTDKRCALPVQLRQLADSVLAMTEAGEELSVIAVKQRWGCGRNLAIDILEYFDSIRFTARDGSSRRVLDTEVPQKVFCE